MPAFKPRDRERLLGEVARILLPDVYISHASNFTRRDDGGYAEYVAREVLRVSEAFIVVLEERP